MGYFITGFGGWSKKLIESGDADFTYAYYCFHKLKMLPSEYGALDIFEKATILAFIDVKLKNDREREKELEKVRKRGK